MLNLCDYWLAFLVCITDMKKRGHLIRSTDLASCIRKPPPLTHNTAVEWTVKFMNNSLGFRTVFMVTIAWQQSYIAVMVDYFYIGLSWMYKCISQCTKGRGHLELTGMLHVGFLWNPLEFNRYQKYRTRIGNVLTSIDINIKAKNWPKLKQIPTCNQ